jgi:Cu/Ag efflux protein CusF
MPAMLAASVLALAGCHGPRTYALTGQVIAIDPARGEVTIRHADIPGLMSGMTMPFKVKDATLLQGGLKPGDLVTATLVVSDTESRVASIVRTGQAPVPERPAAAVATNVLAPGQLVPMRSSSTRAERRTGFPNGGAVWSR